MYDVLIIGGGPAGLSAAIYAARANLNAVVVAKDGGALSKVDKIENYFGFAEAVSGKELLDASKKNAERLGVSFIDGEVLGLMKLKNFTVEVSHNSSEGEDPLANVTNRSETIEAKTVIIATGSARKKIGVKGIDTFEGAGVSYCAICDAFFYRGRSVAVIGSGEYALHEAQQLEHVASKVTILTDGKEVTADFPENYEIEIGKLSEITGSDLVEQIRFEDGKVMPVDGIFVAIGSAGADDLARKIGAQTENGKIKVNEDGETTVPGLYAAGDCIGGLLQISTAVGEGAKAAMRAIAYCRKNG